VQTLRELGVTRISLGVENFDDAILEENGRAHHSAEIARAWQWITDAGFPNANVDLIAGMVGETWDKWRQTVRRTIELSPDSVTIYQMELPFNTVYSQDILGHRLETPVADWSTKRSWVNFAFDEFCAAGYSISSAYTLVKDQGKVNFSYRDNLWRGSDLLATGVASFGHISGVHYQNLSEWPQYIGALEKGELPLWRGMRPTAHQLLIRELILQLKTGYLDVAYFRDKFGADILGQWREVWEEYEREDLLEVSDENIHLTRKGLLQVDALLTAFFEPQHREVRYT
jgi:oxygen-independent coproporphyrinogen-3 oxidase